MPSSFVLYPTALGPFSFTVPRGLPGVFWRFDLGARPPSRSRSFESSHGRAVHVCTWDSIGKRLSFHSGPRPRSPYDLKPYDADLLHASLERTTIKNDSSSYVLYSSSSLAAVVSPMVHTFTQQNALIIFMIRSPTCVEISLLATPEHLPHILKFAVPGTGGRETF